MTRLFLSSAAAALLMAGGAAAQDQGVPIDPAERNAHNRTQDDAGDWTHDKPEDQRDERGMSDPEWNESANPEPYQTQGQDSYETQGESESMMRGSDRMQAGSFDRMFNSRLHQAFSAIDDDGDSAISRNEWGNWQADDGFYAQRFDLFDENEDGNVSWAEYRDAATSLYDVNTLNR